MAHIFKTLSVFKGHGTRNDFVLVPDYDGELVGPLTPELVRALADRRAGIGADGVIRVVRTATAISEALVSAPGDADVPEWFMDYWNSDGTTSEMCGNGVRVFVRFLLDQGLVSAPFTLFTRGGVKTAEVLSNGDIRVGMGRYELPEIAPEFVAAPGLLVGDSAAGRAATSVDMGNPHTVTIVDAAQSLAALDLTAPPRVTPTPVAGTNIEFIQIDTIAQGRGALRLRVHERGVGETEACGTGACAAAVSAYLHAVATGIADIPTEWAVTMPGGTVTISLEADRTTYLAGPAEIVGQVELEPAWLEARKLGLFSDGA